jgi:UDP-glucose 4-epimerase
LLTAPHESSSAVVVLTVDKRILETALVLGGAGFLGGWVTELLRADGVKTTVLGYGARRPGDAALAITRASTEEMLASGPDAVFFLAGSPSVPRSVREPAQDLHDNTGLVVDVLEALRRQETAPVLIFASSAAVYGDSVSDPMDESHPVRPRSPYGVSKLAAEHYVRLYAETYGLPALSVRPFSVYGPRQRKLVIYDLLQRLDAGESPLIVQSVPDVARDFVFVRDVAEAMVTLAKRAPATGESYNLASGVATTLSALTGELIKLTGSHARVEFTGSLRIGDPLRWRGDPSRAAELGIACETPLTKGLEATVKWVLNDLHSSRR